MQIVIKGELRKTLGQKLLQALIHEENVTVMKIETPNMRAPKDMEQPLMDLKEETE